jgi:hypothetical protein
MAAFKRSLQMSVLDPLGAYTAGLLGAKVERATAALPGGTAAAIFTVAGGRVAITQIVGQVTTAIQNQTCNLKITANPTTGTSVDIAANLDVDNDEVGCLYGITGLNSDALLGINAGALPGQTRPVIVNAGTIDLETSATNTGSVKWAIFYVPIDSGAEITAA